MSEAGSKTGDIIEVLRGILPAGKSYVLHEPEFDVREKELVNDCIDTGWVSSVGSYVNDFEDHLAKYMGVARVVVTMNGTAALQICALLAGVKPGDEVLCPSLTFIATANAISYCHAIPHFVEVEENTLGVDPDALRAYLQDIARVDSGVAYNRHTNARLGGLVVMHAFGHPARLDELAAVCAEFHLPLIEDAAESLGSYYKGDHTGRHGLVSALSFNGNKIVTTGGGGAIATNDEALGRRAKHITTTAKQAHPYLFIHDEIGFNYRMPNLNAAMGVAQLEKLPRFLKQKRDLANRYKDAFAGLNHVRFVSEPKDTHSNYWLNAIKVNDRAAREDLLITANAAGIMTRPVWEPMHMLPMYKNCPRAGLALTHDLADRIVNIPSSPHLAL